MPLSATVSPVDQLTADISFIDVLILTANFQFRGDITALTGGGLTDLDGIDMANYPKPFAFAISLSDDWAIYKCRIKAGGETADGTDLVAVKNYDPATNTFIWAKCA